MRASSAVTISILLSCAFLAHCSNAPESSNDGSGGSAGEAGGTAEPDFCVHDPDQPSPAYVVTIPLDVFCDLFGCSGSFDEAITESQRACDGNTFGKTLRQGCGFSWLGSEGGLYASSEVFDESRALVGATDAHDTPYGPCNAAEYRTGVSDPDCDETVSCMMCMPFYGAPVCRFDCDCANMEPDVDPCFGPDSCECYCATLESTIGD